MLIHAKLDSSTVNGPGTRAVIWLQGCTLNCPGCHNPETHSFDKEQTNPSEIFTWIMNLDGVEGITLSGGEPMQHFSDTLAIATFIKDVRPELSLGMFTGYTSRELETGNFQILHPAGAMIRGDAKLWEMLIPHLDFAVMGRFNAHKVTFDKALCGSSNQDVVLFSERYQPSDFKHQETQVTISSEGLVTITGYPGREFIKAVQTM